MRWLFVLSVFSAVSPAALHPLFNSASDTMKEQLNYSSRWNQLGVRNDCTESPLTYEEIEKVATSKEVNNQEDFLKVLNERHPGAMQSFTIVFDSQSAQAGGISEAWPGVIRSTVDSNIIFRYVCDKSATDIYNRVELIHFIHESQKEPARFELVELDLSNPKLKGKARVQKNLSGCIDCHAAENNPYQVRPNWEMYPDWKGMFGSHDDIFKFFDEKDPRHAEKVKEGARFHKFVREKVQGDKADPCYTALPWPKQMRANGDYQTSLPADFVNFPYGIQPRSRNYITRPNLKYTETLSHHLGLRNFSRLKFALKEKGDEVYKKAMTLLALEAAKCDRLIEKPYSQDVLDSHLTDLFSKYSRPTLNDAKIPMLRGFPSPQHEPRHPLGMAQALYATSIALGFYPMDWTLQFVEYDRSDYESGAGFGGTGLDDNPFPSVYGDYNRFLNAYAKKLSVDEKPEFATWVKKNTGEELGTYGDLPLTAYPQNEILKVMAETLPELKGRYWKQPPLSEWKGELNAPETWYFTTTRAEEQWFGEGFACIDDLIGAPAFRSEKTREATCKILRETAAKLGMDESPPKERPKTRGFVDTKPRIPPTRLAAFHRYLEKRIRSEREREVYIHSPQGLKEIKSQEFIEFLKKSYSKK